MHDRLPRGCRIVPLTAKGDERGSLVALEGGRDVPFEIARVYYIFATKGDVTRGRHAHRQLKQLLVPVSGSCLLSLSDGESEAIVRLDRPDKGLLIEGLVWREMSDFSPDCVLLVLADCRYEERDYIRDEETFRRATQAETETPHPAALQPNAPIHVTRPYLPPLAQVEPLLQEIWDSKFVTNQGPFHERFQAELARFLEVDHPALTANGMLALELAIEAAGLTGEVITTPYSFVATAHAISRASLKPVFADVLPGSLNIDPQSVEAAITGRTSGIVAVHCYGAPCDVEALHRIADRHGLALIYDAAHAFGVRHRGRGLLCWGDYAALSFHGTKAFNTFEGGAAIARSADGDRKIKLSRNFGIADELNVSVIGTNAKMSEFNAALGLVQLRHFEAARQERAAIDSRYRAALADITGIYPLPLPADTEPNFSYFPILVTEDYPLSRDDLYDALKAKGIFSRRYFHPLLSNLPMYRQLPSADPANLPVANRAAQQILCLPMYTELSADEQDQVIRALAGAGR